VTQARWHRLVQAVALGLGIGLALISIHGGIVWTDGQVYWMAADRLRSGEPLYPSAGDPEIAFYKYAPWFAWAWVPFTYLPEPIVAIGWTVGMLAAWAAPTASAMRDGWQGRSIAFLAGPPLLVAALGGNIQPAVVAALWAGLDRRWGPLAVGLSASLQVFPILFVVTDAARRQRTRVAVASAVAVLLWLPAFAYGIADYPEIIGGVLSLWRLSPVLYAGVVALAVLWAWRQRSRSAASLLVLIATSARFIPYHLGYLLCSRPQPERSNATGLGPP